MRKIIGIGETVLDIIFRDDQPLKAVPGGSTFNAMISIGRVGVPCLMATEVGDDHVGEIVTDFLAANHVGTDYVYRHAGTQSHLSLAFLNENNDAQYQFYKMHNALDMPEVYPEVNAGDIVVYGSYFAINPKLRSFVLHFLSMAKENGAILYYDINFRASHKKDLPLVMPHIEENIRLATVVRGSSEDFSILYGLDSADEVYEKMISTSCDTFIYTDAANPIQMFTPAGKMLFETAKVETVSTIGAGDNFNAGFCYGLYKEGVESIERVGEQQWKRIVGYGQRFSSCVCQSLDNYISPDEAARLA